MKEGDFFSDFLRGLFHRFNNFLGPCYGKLDLILLYNKPEYRAMLRPEELRHLWDGWSQMASWRSQTNLCSELLAQIRSGQPPMVKELLCDSGGRCEKSLVACGSDETLAKNINHFLTEMTHALPLPSPFTQWVQGDTIHHDLIHRELQGLVSAVRVQEARYLSQ